MDKIQKENAQTVILSTIKNCEKIHPKFAEGTSQHTLLKNRIKALYISKALLTKDVEVEQYTKEELIEAETPIKSIINKCETGQSKHQVNSTHHKRFQNIIDAMKIAKSLIEDEVNRREILNGGNNEKSNRTL